MRRSIWMGLASVSLAAAGVAIGFGLGRDSGRGQVITKTATERQLVAATTTRSPRRSALIPSRFAANYSPRRVPLQELVPADAEVVSAWYLAGRPEMIAVAWLRAEDPGGGPGIFGLAIWRRREAGRTVGWFRMYSHRRWMVGIDVQTADLTHDGRSDLLVREDTGGSAGCGLYRVLSPDAVHVRKLYVRRQCMDQGRIELLNSMLVEIDGVHFVGPGIHCCYRSIMRRLKRWDGRRWVTIQREVRPLSPGTWPPS